MVRRPRGWDSSTVTGVDGLPWQVTVNAMGGTTANATSTDVSVSTTWGSRSAPPTSRPLAHPTSVTNRSIRVLRGSGGVEPYPGTWLSPAGSATTGSQGRPEPNPPNSHLSPRRSNSA